ncbi:MAG: hypothetical protein AAGI30_01510 [Planctomycetota bacterium]
MNRLLTVAALVAAATSASAQVGTDFDGNNPGLTSFSQNPFFSTAQGSNNNRTPNLVSGFDNFGITNTFVAPGQGGSFGSRDNGLNGFPVAGQAYATFGYFRNSAIFGPFDTRDDSVDAPACAEGAFSTDTRGLVSCEKMDNFFLLADVNSPNFDFGGNNGTPGTNFSASWTFDVSSLDLTGDEVFSVDVVALGDFEGSASGAFQDFIDWTYSVDGGSALPLLTTAIDDDASASYPTAFAPIGSASIETLPDPWGYTYVDATTGTTVTQTIINYPFDTLNVELDIPTSASTVTIAFTGFLAGGATNNPEYVGFDNLIIDTVPVPTGACCTGESVGLEIVCSVTTEANCTGTFTANRTCEPELGDGPNGPCDTGPTGACVRDFQAFNLDLATNPTIEQTFLFECQGGTDVFFEGETDQTLVVGQICYGYENGGGLIRNALYDSGIGGTNRILPGDDFESTFDYAGISRTLDASQVNALGIAPRPTFPNSSGGRAFFIEGDEADNTGGPANLYLGGVRGLVEGDAVVASYLAYDFDGRSDPGESRSDPNIGNQGHFSPAFLRIVDAGAPDDGDIQPVGPPFFNPTQDRSFSFSGEDTGGINGAWTTLESVVVRHQELNGVFEPNDSWTIVANLFGDDFADPRDGRFLIDDLCIAFVSQNVGGNGDFGDGEFSTVFEDIVTAPTFVLPDDLGACCDGQGGCVDLVAFSSCTNPDTNFFPGLSCEVVSSFCPAPTGACCVAADDCRDGETLASCDVLGGTFFADETCTPTLCQPVTVACCLTDTSCADVNTVADCDLLSGTAFEDTTCPVDATELCMAGAMECPGDSDGDFDADADDFIAVLVGFGTATGATRADGDFDGDGDVDADDFIQMLVAFGNVYDPADCSVIN